MKNFLNKGDVVTLVTALAVTSGQGVLLGSLFGVAGQNAGAGAEVDLHVVGVYELPKVASQAWTVGALVYWTGTACTVTASTNKLIGVATKAVGAGAGELVGTVRLNAAGITA